MKEKQCSRCERMLSLDKFSTNRRAPDGRRYICRECDTELHRLNYSKDPEKFKTRTATNREYAKENSLCRYCWQPLDGTAKTLCGVCTVKNRVATAKNRNRVKDACFGAYGGYRCACCGETEKSFLHLDHINGGGNIQRRAQFGSVTPGSDTVYRFLVKAGFPAGYQVLCANCNMGKSGDGHCPHHYKPQHPIDAMLSRFENRGIVN